MKSINLLVSTGKRRLSHILVNLGVPAYVCMYVCTVCYEVVLYTDDLQLLYPIYFYMTSVPITNQTNRYTFYLLNTDDINYTIKTLSLCMYVCTEFRPFPFSNHHSVCGTGNPADPATGCGERRKDGRVNAAAGTKRCRHRF